jgi:hypothetical protein
MKVVNEYLATKEGLTAGKMEEKIEGLFDILQKKGASVVTKEDVELLESAKQEEPAREKPGTSNTPPMKRCSKSSPRGRRRDRGPNFELRTTSLSYPHSHGSSVPSCAWLRRWREKQSLRRRRPALRGGPWEFACLILPIPCPSRRRERAA